jgi:hypothetical protein
VAGAAALPLGALLQLPVLALVVFLARRLAHGAAALGRALRGGPTVPGRAPALPAVVAAVTPRRHAPARARGRGPPLPAAA